MDPVSGCSMEYRELITNESIRKDWQTSSTKKFVRLFQGVSKRVTGTNTCNLIQKSAGPKKKRPTYARFFCTVQLQKSEPNHTRLTVGGNLIHFPGNKSTRTANINTTKMLMEALLRRAQDWRFAVLSACYKTLINPESHL